LSKKKSGAPEYCMARLSNGTLSLKILIFIRRDNVVAADFNCTLVFNTGAPAHYVVLIMHDIVSYYFNVQDA
jgi:hypothetical protein